MWHKKCLLQLWVQLCKEMKLLWAWLLTCFAWLCSWVIIYLIKMHFLVSRVWRFKFANSDPCYTYSFIENVLSQQNVGYFCNLLPKTWTYHALGNGCMMEPFKGMYTARKLCARSIKLTLLVWFHFFFKECRRYEQPHKAFTYHAHGYESVVGPVKGVFGKESSLTKAREHSLLVSERPPYVTILSLGKLTRWTGIHLIIFLSL